MTIGTKFLRGKFYCYATIEGYDHCFDGDTVDEAQKQMRDLLDKKVIAGNVEWEAIKIIEEPPVTNPKRYPGDASMRIDYNPGLWCRLRKFICTLAARMVYSKNKCEAGGALTGNEMTLRSMGNEMDGQRINKTPEEEFDCRFSFMKNIVSEKEYNSTRHYFCLKKYLFL